MRIKFVPPKEQTEKYKIEKKNRAYLLNTPPLICIIITSIVFWLDLKVAYSNEVGTKIQVFHQIESCFMTEFVFSILVQKTGEVIHSFPLIG